MNPTKQPQQEVRDFKDRFEFKLTMKNKEDGSENIICQRYFKINFYNPTVANSFDLAYAIRDCARMIDEDLKSKSLKYLEIFSPMYFDTVEQMNAYYTSAKNRARMHMGEGIIVKENAEHAYFWNGKEPVELDYRFNDGDLGAKLTDTDSVEYKLAFYDYGIDFATNNRPKELCSTVWTGIYPKYVRNSIDLSNRRGRVDEEDLSKLSFEQYLMYKLVEGRQDLVFHTIKNICQVCSQQDDDWYETSDTYTDTETGISVEYNNARSQFSLSSRKNLYQNRPRNKSKK